MSAVAIPLANEGGAAEGDRRRARPSKGGESLSRRARLSLFAVLGLGYAARVGWIFQDKASSPHPDLPSFIEPSLRLLNPFDSGMREPGFVWWLWLIRQFGVSGFLGIRLVTALWFIGTAAFVFFLARRLLGEKRAWIVLGFYSFLPTQIQADGLGMRHLVESFGMAWMLWALLTAEGLSPSRRWVHAAASVALLVMVRISFLGSSALFLLYGALRRRSRALLAALAPALFLLFFHFRANERRFGDPFYTINIHSYWFANAEFIGQPGFPASFEEWQKDAHRKTLTYRQWMFDRHSPMEIVGAHLVGYYRFFWFSPEKTYFPAWFGPLRWLALGALLVGFGTAFYSAALRPVLMAMTFYAWPYAFPGHVHWAGRFFVPVSYLFLILIVAGGETLWGFLRIGFASLFVGRSGKGR
ncbi:MAG TPA: hypothetical protein PK362_07530 [Elusimicrobiota bacterium]|nr:hypothetical protein [Elusimicrobiota bacterium]